jgi:hypothetical protein
MTRSRRIAVAIAGIVVPAVLALAQSRSLVGTDELRGPDAFTALDDRHRSIALFEEAGKVLTHPRCVNCHPAGDRPLQTDLGLAHTPPVERGSDGFGAAGMRCATCHQAENVDLEDRSVPGHPMWHVAPLEMAWEGKSLGEICEQLKDPARNGGHDLDFIEQHMVHDSLVGWAWRPGRGRTPVPGTQAVFGQLIAAWIDTGAHCPRAAH